MRTIALLLLTVLYQPAAGQSPRAVITGPKESRPGSLVVLDATESQGLGRVWLLAVSPEPTSFLPVESGLKVIFASPTPGEYTFVLIVSGTNANGGPMGDMATHTVTLLGATPPPPPPPGPDPTPGPGPAPGPGPNPQPPPATNPYPTPSQTRQDATATIRATKLDRADATNLATLYQDASRLVASAPAAIAAGTRPEIATTGDLRAWLVSNGRELGLQGRYAGLADAVDRFLGQQAGTAIRNVTASDATMLSALAWAVWEAGR